MDPASGESDIFPLPADRMIDIISVCHAGPVELFEESLRILLLSAGMEVIQCERMRFQISGPVDPHIALGTGRPAVTVYG